MDSLNYAAKSQDKPVILDNGKQFLTFAFIGVVNTALDFSVYLFLTRTFGFFSFS